MNHVERFRAVMNFQPFDRLPRWEWATWWDKTITRWYSEGLPDDLKGTFEISEYFKLDPFKQFDAEKEDAHANRSTTGH